MPNPSLTVPLPRRRLDGCACSSPLAHFYIYHPLSSLRELHPFTTTTHLASQNMCTPNTSDSISIQFLFRKRGASPAREGGGDVTAERSLGFAPSLFALIRRLRWEKKGSAKSQMQWTEKLASLADGATMTTTTKTGRASAGSKDARALTMNDDDARESGMAKDVSIALRLEGPYFTPANPARYDTVVCIVAGTGVSGALAIANAFAEVDRRVVSSSGRASVAEEGRVEGKRKTSVASVLTLQQTALEAAAAVTKRTWKRCVVIWSVREDDYVDLAALMGREVQGLDVRVHRTGKGRARVDVGRELDRILVENEALRTGGEQESMWCYVSGPNAFIHAGEVACKERQGKGVDWYGAKWEI